MQVARRAYLYLVSFISLVMVLSGASNLLRVLLERLLGVLPQDSGYIGFTGDYWRDQLSLWGAILLVGAVVWAIHWFLAQRYVAASNPGAAEERLSALRKLFIYAVLATALVQVASSTADLLMALLRLFPSPDTQSLSSVFSYAFPQLVVYGVGGLYYWNIRRQDNRVVPEEGVPATVRRWYFYLASYVALSIVMAQIASLARYIWQFVTDSIRPWSTDAQWIPAVMANALAWIVVAGAVWLLHWSTTQRWMATSDAEQHSPLRKVYLYGMTLQTVAVTLGSMAFFLYNLMRFFWGTDPVAGTDESVLTAVGGPLASVLVYGAFWFYHWQVIRWDSSLVVSELPLQAAIRQLYNYLVALIGLGMLAAGVVDLLRLLFGLLVSSNEIVSMSARAWGDQFSFIVTMVLVGLAAWLPSWLIAQREAMPAGGEVARYALPRRLYLILVIFATVITLLSSVAVLLYQLLRNLGEPAGSWLDTISWALAATITAGILLAYHLYILVGDQRAHAALLRARPPQPALEAAAGVVPATILLLRGEAAAIDASIAALRGSLPDGAAVDSFSAPGITPSEVSAWLSSRAAAAAPRTPPAPQAGQPAGTQPVPA